MKAFTFIPGSATNVIAARSSGVNCTTTHTGLIAVVLPHPGVSPIEDLLSNRKGYTITDGFNGGSFGSFAVTDDDQAQLCTEFQRLGGANVVGYPVTERFMHKGYLTQVFQKLALQWRPEYGAAAPVNVLDDLNAAGFDTWLDTYRQVPVAADTSADVGLPFEGVVARHVALLDEYPALRGFWNADSEAITKYGLPLCVKSYGAFVAVRLQPAVMQLWLIDTPWAAAGMVVLANGGDVAKEAGLWPIEALVPQQAVVLGRPG